MQTRQTDAWGVPTRTEGGGGQPFGFTGAEQDEVGLLNLRARVYVPSLGRFLQADPVRKSGPGVSGWNRYSYAGNNPTSAVDPSGLYSYRMDWWIGSPEMVGTPESVMAYFQQQPREVFPFNLGQCDTIQLGARCDLQVVPWATSPVEVTNVTPTSFTFTALEGHFDAPGSTVTFLIQEQDLFLLGRSIVLVGLLAFAASGRLGRVLIILNGAVWAENLLNEALIWFLVSRGALL